MANLSDLAMPATEAPIGRGLAGMARNTIMLKKAYDQYVMDASESGQEVLPFNDWVASQSNG